MKANLESSVSLHSIHFSLGYQNAHDCGCALRNLLASIPIIQLPIFRQSGSCVSGFLANDKKKVADQNGNPRIENELSNATRPAKLDGDSYQKLHHPSFRQTCRVIRLLSVVELDQF